MSTSNLQRASWTPASPGSARRGCHGVTTAAAQNSARGRGRRRRRSRWIGCGNRRVCHTSRSSAGLAGGTRVIPLWCTGSYNFVTLRSSGCSEHLTKAPAAPSNWDQCWGQHSGAIELTCLNIFQVHSSLEQSHVAVEDLVIPLEDKPADWSRMGTGARALAQQQVPQPVRPRLPRRQRRRRD